MDDEKYIVRAGDTKLAGLREEGHVAKSEEHKYFLFKDAPVKGANTQASFIIIEHLFGQIKSNQKWYKDKNLYDFNWTDFGGKTQTSIKLNYLIVAKYLRENGSFSNKDFNLPEMECYWLDKSGDFNINFHKFDANTKEALTLADGIPAAQFGENYPIKPKLDREGHIFTTLQPQLLKRIIKARKTLVENSQDALHYEWVMDLRALVNDTIALLEITLNQIYIKAEFDPLPTWTFDLNILGVKHGRRLIDKLKWIKQITNKNLNIEPERNSLDELKDLRNHLNHFDPPSLTITLEEATKWLNQIIDIGFILVKIRKTICVEISESLIDFILQKEVYFNPEPAFAERLPLDSVKGGYKTSTW